MSPIPPRILTIAGSDSGGGAGIQADVRTITALGGYAMTAVTALTAQDTTGVHGIHAVPAAFVALQVDVVARDIGVDAAKTGMLGRADVVEAVADAVRRHRIERLVVDPVMVAKGGACLLEDAALAALREKLLPLAMVATPNLPEAAALARGEVRTVAEMREAARHICGLGARWVLVKGGHLEGDPVDVLSDGRDVIELRRPRVDTPHTHGTGCTFSAALATFLGAGRSVPDAVAAARDVVQRAIEHALPLGRGHGPVRTFPPR